MGEAKRRATTGRTDEERLPDFIFGRDKASEEAGGFILAGKLVTDIPKREEPSERDMQLISEIIEELTRRARRDPHLQEVGCWRDGAKPTDGLSPPFGDAPMLARMKRCVVMLVRVDPRNDGFLRLDDGLLADVMGRH